MLPKNDNVYEMPETIRVKKTHHFSCLHPIRIILYLLEKAGLQIYEEEKASPYFSYYRSPKQKIKQVNG